MMMTYHIKMIAFTLVCLLCLDIVYLFLMKGITVPLIRGIQGSDLKLNITSAVACYLLLGVGIYTFLIREKRTPRYAFLLGLFVYGVYETTTKAVLKKWPWFIVFVDTLWGGILFASTTYIMRRMFP